MGKRTIMLTGCGGIPTQNVVMSLRHTRDQYRLIGVECDKHSVFFAQGFDRKYLVPNATESSYISVLNDIIQGEGVEFLHPQPDVEVAVLSAKRHDVETRLMLPAHEVVELCHNKFALLARLRQAGIGTARNVLVEGEADLKTAMGEFGPKLWLRAVRGAAGLGSLPVENLDHARMWIDYWQGWGAFTAEEYLPGRNLAWQGVYKDGKLVGSIAYERIKYLIPLVSPSRMTGTTAVSKLVSDKDVHGIGRQTVEAIDPNPTGIFGVDLKGNIEGVPYVTEVNVGRFFQHSFMFAKSGYNLVETFFDVVFGRAEPGDFVEQARVPEGLYWLRGVDVLPIMRTLEKFPEIGELCE